MYYDANAVEWSSWLCLGMFFAWTQEKRSSDKWNRKSRKFNFLQPTIPSIEHTFGVLQLYNAMIHDRAWFLNSKLFWSTAICTIFVIALSAGGWVGNSAAVQYVVARSVKNFNCAILVLVDGVWAASQIILNKTFPVEYFSLLLIHESTISYLNEACICKSDGKYSCTNCNVFQIFPCIEPSSSVPNLLKSLVSNMNSQSCRSFEWDKINSLTLSKKRAYTLVWLSMNIFRNKSKTVCWLYQLSRGRYYKRFFLILASNKPVTDRVSVCFRQINIGSSLSGHLFVRPNASMNNT